MITTILGVLLGLITVLAIFYGMQVRKLKRKYKDHERKVAEVMTVDKIKNDFLSIAQHQLRTPLSGVKWALEMLKADDTIPLQAQSIIDQSIERVNDSISIVNEMLKTAEESNTDILKKEAVDVAGMIRAIVAELNFNVVRKEVVVNISGPKSLVIDGDRNKLKPALLNVIDNAIIYSPKGSVDITIEDGESSVRITVKDTGIGIAPEDIPFLFESMHRGQNAVRLEPGESGVGLTISKRIIVLHGGTINLDSKLDNGTRVVIILPKKI